MDDTTLAAIRNHLKLNEGVVPHPYLDTSLGRLITTGTGFNIDGPATFRAQSWLVRGADGNLRPATRQEIDDAYARMMAEKNGAAGRPAPAFANSTNLRLPDSANDAQLDRKIQEHADGVIRDIGQDAWDRLSDGQKAVMVDVHYAKGNLDGFERLKKAAKSANAQGMANESQFQAGKYPDEMPRYNWDRVARNRAAAQGISFEDAQREVADKFKDHPHLPQNYKDLVPPTPAAPPSGMKTGDSGDGGEQPPVANAGSSDLPTLTDQDEADLTTDFASWNMVLNGSDGADF